MSKRSSNHCPSCGRWSGDVLCECRIKQVRREATGQRNMELCLKAGDRQAQRRERLVAEVCGEACV